MASYSSKSLLGFTIPSVFGIISILWLLRRKSSRSRQEEKPKEEISSSQYTYFMKLKNSEDGSTSCQSNNCAEMQLKEVESSSSKPTSKKNGISKAKNKKKMKASKVCGNGAICSAKAAINGSSKDNTFSSEEDEIFSNGVSKLNLNGNSLSNDSNMNDDKAPSSDAMVNGNVVKSNDHNQSVNQIENGSTEKPNCSTSPDSCGNSDLFVVESNCDKDSERHSVCSDCSSGVSDCSTNSILDAHIDREGSPTICAQSPHYDSGLETNGTTLSHSQVNPDGHSSPDSVANELHLSADVSRNVEFTDTLYQTDLPAPIQNSTLTKDSDESNTDQLSIPSDLSSNNVENLDKDSVPQNDLSNGQSTAEAPIPLSNVAFNINAESFTPSMPLVEDNNFESIANSDEPIEDGHFLDIAQPIEQPTIIGFIPVQYELPVPVDGVLNEDGSVAFQTMAEKEWKQIFINYASANLKFFPNAATAEGTADIYGIPPPCEDEEMFDVYEFEIQPKHCGRLIGRSGRNVKLIYEEAEAQIMILPHPFLDDMKLCSVHGTPAQIEAALKLIRARIFPVTRFPEVSLAQLNNSNPSVESLQLPLPESVTVDVCLTCTVNPGHIFVQQPTHSTFHQLGPLSNYMTQNYSTYSSPMLTNLAKGNVCAVYLNTGWYRAEVCDIFDDGTVRVKFLDYGGYATVSQAVLRKIRYEFAQIPFQAAECYLANIAPAGEEWTSEALAFFESMLQDKLLQCQVVGYADNRVPLIHLYVSIDSTTVFINNAMVEAGFAQFIPSSK